jgi:hypothetical protein
VILVLKELSLAGSPVELLWMTLAAVIALSR